ncbi:type II secretion system F family protein [Cerasicoccus arenae]|uniref:General secretion pathway protein F n=1 Tax=Cerasicoccus arenae TaxID=424488 RepID=A0A8J3DET8_9BACT|nr:type II secretion system F family protein [Cerasicoccus arenae]MBK1858277.1 type II secretion system F family protein [Cerasicoccus arenae]GHB90476.1 type II secretion system protein F [Cerasicoccus arenae]
MAKFSYTAIDPSGKQKSGAIDAASEEDAQSKLSGMGLMVSKISQQADTSKKSRRAASAANTGGKKSGGFRFGPIINQENLTIFTRQMATLLQAGLPLLRSIEVMIRQEKNPAFKDVLVQIADNVRSGNNFSDGLAQHPKIFKPLFINMIKAGEAGGVLDVVLTRLAKFMEKDLKTRKKIQSAMIYPAVIISVAMIIVLGLLMFIVPKFQEIFETMLKGQPMPALTRFVIDAGNVVKPTGFIDALIKIVVAVGLFFLARFLISTGPGQKAKDWLALNTPKVGELVSKAAISRFTRTFGTLLSSGVPILQALNITRDVIGNSRIASALDRVHDRVRDGESLATPLEQQKIFPTMVTSMIDVGEETGELAEMLNRIADNYDEDVDNAVNSITSIIEPIMIIFLAVIVGTIVIALFLPIIGIIQGLT